MTDSGRLQDKFLPAMYLDTSFLIDYWLAEGMEVEMEGENEWDLERTNESPHLHVIRNIINSDKRISKVADIRKKVIYDKPKVVPVFSPISLLELMERQAEAAFKQIASEAVGAINIQRGGKKDIGEKLKHVIKERKKELEKQKEERSAVSTGLEILIMETMLNRSFVDCHGLSGLMQVDIINFDLNIDRVWAEPSAYAYIQLGAADIMHILFAQHLGCEYFATFDSDFKRAKNIIKDETGINVLLSPEDIVKVL